MTPTDDRFEYSPDDLLDQTSITNKILEMFESGEVEHIKALPILLGILSYLYNTGKDTYDSKEHFLYVCVTILDEAVDLMKSIGTEKFRAEVRG